MSAGDFTMTSIAPVLYSAAQTVSQEPIGFLNSISTTFDDKGVAKGDTVYVPYTAKNTVAEYTPAAYADLGTAATASSIGISISKSYMDSWSVSGEQERSLLNGDNGAEWLRLKTENAMRTVRNAMEVLAFTAVKNGSSRATGTAGTTPFASDLTALTAAKKILVDNGASLSDLQCVMNSDAAMNLSNLGIYNQAMIAGSDTERRTGKYLPQHGFNISVSGGISSHTAGAGTGYDLTSASHPVGTTTLITESGTINGTGFVAGDVITKAGGATDANKYVVNTGLAATSGNLVINRPGLVVVGADADELTIGGSYTGAFCFERSAVVGVVRPPLIPASAILQTQLVTDQFGLTYLFVRCIGDGIITYRIHLCGGFKSVQSEHIATILG